MIGNSRMHKFLVLFFPVLFLKVHTYNLNVKMNVWLTGLINKDIYITIGREKTL